MPTSQNLPEGTDTIINGAASDGRDDSTGGTSFATAGQSGAAASGGASAGDGQPADDASGGSLRDQFAAKSDELKGQATDKVRDYVEQGRTRATEALDNVSRMIGDAAGTVDEKIGADYGDYARRAQAAVDGFTANIRDKDVDQLVADLRDLVQRSPALAAGAAALVGFALVRLIRSGLPDDLGTGTRIDTGTARA